MQNFEGFGLSDALNKSLAHMKYSTPTPIQAQAIPIALQGQDIMGTAQTGTGKTAAFAIPLIEHLYNNERSNALVLAPTREIGKQIMDVMHQMLGFKSGIKTAFIIGGEPMGKQLRQLRARPRLIVGTPGRMNDHLERRNIDLEHTDFLVLDETDRMLDMGFSVQLERIFKYLPQERQTLMFSATLPKNILSLSEQYLNSPKRIAMGETNVLAQNIKQEVVRIEQGDKYKELTMQLHERNGSVIVFVKTKHGADKMAKKLRADGFTSEALHGDLRQNKRDKVMRNFRTQNFRILIATDIAARGLDVPHIEHVVNYDLPQVAEDYIHRMGRTARAGAKGSAISFVSNQDGRKWHAIECLLDPSKAANDRGGERRSNSSKRKRNHRGGGKPFGKFAGKPGAKSNGKRSDKPQDKNFDAKQPGGKRSEGKRSKNKNFGGKKSSFKSKGGINKGGSYKGSGKPKHAGQKKSFKQVKKRAA